jgi:hypothetical protein
MQQEESDDENLEYVAPDSSKESIRSKKMIVGLVEVEVDMANPLTKNIREGF